MSRACAIFAPGGLGLPTSPFGKDVANLGLYRALARHGGFDELSFLLSQATAPEQLARVLFDGATHATRISTGSLLNTAQPTASGILLRGKADLAELAWWRQEASDARAYSLVGLVHCVAPPALRRYIAEAALAPVERWDALICTSPVVRDNLQRMYEGWSEHLARRFGAPKGEPRMPSLPVIPLGVEAERFANAADRPEVRAAMRSELNIAEDDVVVLWVGRLSFFEKAFPQPMFRAVAESAALARKRLHLVMAGWFPNGDAGRLQYEEAARHYAPDLPLILLDGRDPAQVDRLWAASDIFLSLVDNVQETFGITPVEAMAAGLPVVVSDWDGYRATVEDGVQGFRIPTLGGPPGLGELMLRRHLYEMESYQNYVGTVAQHTAVQVGRAAAAIAALAADPELRARMGAAGRARVRAAFAWPVVVGQLRALFADLAERRARAAPFSEGAARPDPVRPEPFGDFADFATATLADDVRLVRRAGPGAGPPALDRYAGHWRASPAETEHLLTRLVVPTTVRALLDGVPPERRAGLQASLMWLCKLGVVDWQVA